MADNNKEYNPDLITLTDDDGKEYTFEVLDAIETDEARYLALLPTYDDPKKLLEESGELLGYACQFIVCEDAEILNIAVAPEQRNKGLGGVLMEEMLREAKALGAEKTFLEVRKTNLSAQSLYRRFGFEEYGVRKNYYPDGEDAILMQRRFDCAK